METRKGKERKQPNLGFAVFFILKSLENCKAQKRNAETLSLVPFSLFSPPRGLDSATAILKIE